jgi:hypothetical protein
VRGCLRGHASGLKPSSLPELIAALEALRHPKSFCIRILSCTQILFCAKGAGVTETPCGARVGAGR